MSTDYIVATAAEITERLERHLDAGWEINQRDLAEDVAWIARQLARRPDQSATAPAEIGRCKLFSSDRMEFVTEGEDRNGYKCWRTYVGTTTPDGRMMFNMESLAYSPPNDWNELGRP